MGNSPENRFGPQNPEFAFLGLAHSVTGRDFPNSQEGLTEAIAAMQEQHQKAMPSFSYDEAEFLISEWEPVHFAEVLAQNSLSAEDFDESLYFSNRAFQFSLRFHRQFAELIRDRFSGTDPYLKVAGK